MKYRNTDYGTVILHGLFVVALGTAFVSGLRIAGETPDRTWVNMFDAVLPSKVWVLHIQAAAALVGIALAYAVYLVRTGLVARVRLDQVRLRGLFGKGQARLRAVNVLLYWLFFAACGTLFASGGLLYFGLFAGHDVAALHWYATWAVPAFVVVHILLHLRLGGLSQLLRILRPSRLSAPPPPLDAVELLTLLAEQSARLQPEAERGEDSAPDVRLQPSHPTEQEAPRRNERRRPRHPTIQANPLVVAAAVAITGVSLIVATDRVATDRLMVRRIASADAPVLDGDTSDRVWRNIHPLSLVTSHGGNFDGAGETRVEVRAVHDGTWAYFLFTWNDPTRSLKQLPLVKEADGWRLLHNGFEKGDEHDYNEDKLAVLFTRADVILAGDRSFHAGPHPVADAPATMSGRGLHFTSADIGIVDVWQWKATNGGATGWMDDGHFGPPLPPTPQQAAQLAPYKGGYAPDPGFANTTDNFDSRLVGGDGRGVLPRRLPKDAAAMRSAMGEIDLDPDHGEAKGSRWFMWEQESLPYASETDTRIPIGTVIPGVIASGSFTGDRADIRCAARWASGHWALEVARRLDTGSPYDVAIASGTFMRIAAFDHSQIRHTRHVRPIRIEVE